MDWKIVIETAATANGTTSDMVPHSKKFECTDARCMVVGLLRDNGFTYDFIARTLGIKTAGAVTASRRHSEMMRIYPWYRERYAEVVQKTKHD